MKLIKAPTDYPPEGYAAMHIVMDIMCLYLYGPFPELSIQQVLKIYDPNYTEYKLMRDFVDSVGYIQIPPYYHRDKDAQRRAYHDRISHDDTYSVIVNYINHLSEESMMNGPSEQFRAFVDRCCVTHHRDFNLAWYIALVRWDERLYDLKLKLKDPESKGLKRVVNNETY